MILLDTSGLYAALSPGQAAHERVRPALEREDGPLILSPFVLAEVDNFLVRWEGVDSEAAWLREVAAGAYDLASFATDDVTEALALSDKIDTLVGFWAIDEKPTGSKDPFALRRAALGVIRIVLENGLRLPLTRAFSAAASRLPKASAGLGEELLAFFADRLKVHLREQGVRHDLVSAVFALGNEDDLVRQANDSAYGLAAGIWTADYRRAWRVARRLEAGTVWVNTYKQLSIAAPFGGFKDSGVGREKGIGGVRLYQQAKSVYWGM